MYDLSYDASSTPYKTSKNKKDIIDKLVIRSNCYVFRKMPLIIYNDPILNVYKTFVRLPLACSPTLPSIEECSDVQCIALMPKKKQNLIVIEI